MLIILLLIVSSTAAYINDKHPIVRTALTKFQGKTSSFQGQLYDEFLGIRFAFPPVGPLRFKPPILYNRTWSGVYKATQYGAACMQVKSLKGFSMSEDCLFLNIWRPHVSSGQPLPILFFAHGSGFMTGSAAKPDLSGEILSSTGNIIVVSSNYRLGFLGYGYGHPSEMPGNLGVYDVIAALQWVQDNIAAFGGDPTRVTLSGQSAGSMMSSIISGLPLIQSSNLYSKMFMMSGAAVHEMFIEPSSTGLAKTRLLADKVNCSDFESNQNSDELTWHQIQCLRSISPDKLIETSLSDDIIRLGHVEMMAFIPVYGTHLVPNRTMELITSRPKNRKIDIIIGTEQNEVVNFYNYSNITQLSDAYQFLWDRLSVLKHNLTKSELDSFYQTYFNQSASWDSFRLKHKALEFIHDFQWHCPSLLMSEAYSLKDNVRYYINSYINDGVGREARPFGTEHGDVIISFFGQPFKKPEQFSDHDRHFSQRMMKFLTDFVKGADFGSWPAIALDLKSIEVNQKVRKLTLRLNEISVDPKQSLCLKWSALLNYSIST